MYEVYIWYVVIHVCYVLLRGTHTLRRRWLPLVRFSPICSSTICSCFLLVYHMIPRIGPPRPTITPSPPILEVATPRNERKIEAVILVHESTHKVWKSASRVVLCRMHFTVHVTPRTPHGASRLVQAMSAWSAKTRRAPSRHSRSMVVRLRLCMT